MAKPLTVNEMIYKTLTTKITKVPKYKDVLEALGYVLDKDHDWSAYDYWGIKVAENNQTLLISKGMDGKRRLYRTASYIKTNDITKVDFVNLIKTDRSSTRWYNTKPLETKTQKYKSAKYDYNLYMSIAKDKEKAVETAIENLEKARADLERWEEYAAKRKDRLDEVIAAFKRRETA